MNAPVRFPEFGQPTFDLDLAIHTIVQRAARRRQLVRDYRGIKKACRVNGRWVACQIDAGMFGDAYSGITLPDAMDYARACWAEIREEMRDA